MKNIKLTLALIILATLTVSPVRANDITYVEKYVMGDRKAALALLIPGTRDYYYYHALDAQLRGDGQEVKRLVGLWVKRHGKTGRVREILDRQALLDFEKDKAGTLAYLRKELGLGYNHSRIIEGQKPKHPTVLDAKVISFGAYQARVFRSGDLSGVEDAGLDRLDLGALSATRLRHLLSSLQRADVPGLVRLIVKDLNNRYSRGFGSHGIHRQLTKEQMDELLQLEPKLINNSNFINAYLTKLAPSNDVDVRFDLEEQGKHLNRVQRDVQPAAV